VSRRRDLSPTLERKEGQLETLGRSLAKAQETERRLKRELRDMQKNNRSLLQQVADLGQALARQRDAHEERIATYQRILSAPPPEPPEAPGLLQRIVSKFTSPT
jgi:septal ring factor EnvC (AmiA/AmiB activator)